MEQIRWEDIVSSGKWHFDPLKKTKDYFSVGRFVGDWEEELRGLDLSCFESSFVGEGDCNCNDIWLSWGYKKGLIHYLYTDEVPAVFEKMGDYFKLSYTRTTIHSQLPGHMNPLHLDQYLRLKEKLQQSGKLSDTTKFVRMLVALEDWEWGHYILIGNSVWHQWRKGDIVTLEEEVPHLTANAGKKARHMLTITGVLNEKNLNLFRGKYKKILVGK